MLIIIETPRQCTGKYVYDGASKTFRLKKLLPLGMSFPYDFGMIPGTKGEDGDPLDAMVITECNTFPGVELDCRLIGALSAEQVSPNKKPIRNDRFIFIPDETIVYRHIKDISDFSTDHNRQLEDFFVNYNKTEGREFRPIAWLAPGRARELLEKYAS